jgi:hypothetical protein
MWPATARSATGAATGTAGNPHEAPAAVAPKEDARFHKWQKEDLDLVPYTPH